MAEFTQPHRFEASVTCFSLGYFAILKAPDDATDDAGGDAGDSAFTATGGVIHDDAPTGMPTPVPSPARESGESLYKLEMTDSGADGWEGASYQIVRSDGTVEASGTLDNGASERQYVCLPDGDYELTLDAAGGGAGGDDAAGDGDASDDDVMCATIVGPNGGSHRGCLGGADDDGSGSGAGDDAGGAGEDDSVDSSFAAAGGVVHDEHPTGMPTPVPSPECPTGESLYKLEMTDSGADGWEGASYQIVRSDGTVEASGTLDDGASELQYACLPDGDYELTLDAAGGGAGGDDAAGDGDASDDDVMCATIVGPNSGSHRVCLGGADDDGEWLRRGRRCGRCWRTTRLIPLSRRPAALFTMSIRRACRRRCRVPHQQVWAASTAA